METITEILKLLHTLLEKDTDYPTSSDEDYLLRLELLKDAIMVWEYDNENGTLWNELYTTLQDSDVSLGGEKTTVLAQSSYDCPSDFVFPNSYVKIGTGDTTVYYKRIGPKETSIYDNSGLNVYYVRGNKKAGFKIHLNEAPAAGLDIDYDYYKSAFQPTTGTDVLEMADPQFSIYWTLAELVKDDDPGLASQYQQVALNKLDAMRMRNNQQSYGQDNLVFDTIGGFGH